MGGVKMKDLYTKQPLPLSSFLPSLTFALFSWFLMNSAYISMWGMNESSSSPRQVHGFAKVFFSWEQNSLWSIRRLSLSLEKREKDIRREEGKEGRGGGEWRLRREGGRGRGWERGGREGEEGEGWKMERGGGWRRKRMTELIDLI